MCLEVNNLHRGSLIQALGGDRRQAAKERRKQQSYRMFSHLNRTHHCQAAEKGTNRRIRSLQSNGLREISQRNPRPDLHAWVSARTTSRRVVVSMDKKEPSLVSQYAWPALWSYLSQQRKPNRQQSQPKRDHCKSIAGRRLSHHNETDCCPWFDQTCNTHSLL